MASMAWDTRYIHPDLDSNPHADEDGLWWFSPDGVGRVWFDTLAEAEYETGLPPIS